MYRLGIGRGEVPRVRGGFNTFNVLNVVVVAPVYPLSPQPPALPPPTLKILSRTVEVGALIWPFVRMLAPPPIPRRAFRPHAFVTPTPTSRLRPSSNHTAHQRRPCYSESSRG